MNEGGAALVCGSMFVLALLACNPNPRLVRQGTLFGSPKGVALYDEGWKGGRVGMFGTTCDVTVTGDVGSEYDFGWEEETVTDAEGLKVVVVSGDEVMVQDGRSWWGEPLYEAHTVRGVRDARLVDGELVALRREGVACELVWPETGEVEASPCGRLVELPSGPRVLAELDGAAWDPHHQRLLIGEGRTLSALTEDGELLWSLELDGRVTAVAPTAEAAAVSLVYEDGSGAVSLVEQGVVLDTPTTSWAGHALEVSGDGQNLALLRDSSVVFYELW